MASEKKSIRIEVAKELAEKVCKELEQWCEKIEIAGSIRRKKPIVHDIDLIGIPKEEYTREFVAQKFCSMGQKVMVSGFTKSSIVKDGIQIDLNLNARNQGNYGSLLLHFTGSAGSNMKLRTVAKKKGYMLNQYGVYALNEDGSTRECIAGATEESVFEVLGLAFVPPERRD